MINMKITLKWILLLSFEVTKKIIEGNAVFSKKVQVFSHHVPGFIFKKISSKKKNFKTLKTLLSTLFGPLVPRIASRILE